VVWTPVPITRIESESVKAAVTGRTVKDSDYIITKKLCLWFAES
jgi:hypothetical protein